MMGWGALILAIAALSLACYTLGFRAGERSMQEQLFNQAAREKP